MYEQGHKLSSSSSPAPALAVFAPSNNAFQAAVLAGDVTKEQLQVSCQQPALGWLAMARHPVQPRRSRFALAGLSNLTGGHGCRESKPGAVD